MRRCLPIAALSVVVLVVCAQASAAVRVTHFTARVPAAEDATITVNVAPTARCTITVVYDTVVSHARGLRLKRGGTITWTWRVGSNTHPGRWPVTIDCGKSGKAKRTLTVLPR